MRQIKYLSIVSIAILAFFLLMTLSVGAESLGSGWGYYQVTSAPPGASVSLDGYYQGTTPISLPISVDAPPGHTIKVEKDGYETWEQYEGRSPGNGMTIHINAKLVSLYPTTPQRPTRTSYPTKTKIIGGGTGYYYIASTPPGADVKFDGTVKGQTPITVSVSTDGAPGHLISISKDGYQTWSTREPGNPMDGETVSLVAVLVPIPPVTTNPTSLTSSIFVKSIPSGGVVTLDGGSGQIAPTSFVGVSPYYHTIRVMLSGYQVWSNGIYVNPGETKTLTASLIRIGPKNGWISVNSIPSGADVYIDGSYRGYTALTTGDLAPGDHTVELRLSGYQTWKSTSTVTPGGTNTLSVTMTKNPQKSTTGDISVNSNPAGASVYLNGNYKGDTQLNDGLDIVGLNTGTYTLLLKLTGYNDYTSNVNIAADQVSAIKAELVKSATSPTTGQIDIGSDPSGADIYLDNAYKGITPLTLQNVEAGDRTVVLKMEGYTDWSGTMKISGGQIAQINAKMQVSGQSTATSEIPTTKSRLSIIPIIAAICSIGLIFVTRKKKNR